MNKTRPAFGILCSICLCHLNNDMLQSLLAAVYPTLKTEYHLTFAQIGLVTLAYQMTASILQPMMGLWTDRKPTPLFLPIGTVFTFAGLVVLSAARTYPILLAGACILGVGSSTFHPESSRVARMASGGRLGLAQSLFQVGGNAGSALGPAGAAVVLQRWGQRGLGAFAISALLSATILGRVGFWAKRHGGLLLGEMGSRSSKATDDTTLSGTRVKCALAVLLALMFSKFVYLASISSYYTFFLMHRFGVSLRDAQLHLVAFMAAAAAGTLAGGPLGDRFGRKYVVWFSIVGVLPFTAALPHADLFWTGALSVVIGFILASAFPAIVVYGQELLPGRIGLVAGLIFGLSFGVAGGGAALLGALADATSIESVYDACAFLPAIGLLAALLPDLGTAARTAAAPARAVTR
jgi:FSR family fosmidomycin resistance protein-like MFS transporter